MYLASFLCGDLDGDVQAGPGGQGDEHFEAELLPFAARQIGDAGLTNAQEFGRLGLRQLLGLEDLYLARRRRDAG